MTTLAIQPTTPRSTRWMDVHRLLGRCFRPPDIGYLLAGIAGLCWLCDVSIFLAPVHLGALCTLWIITGIVLRTDWRAQAIAELLTSDAVRFRQAASWALGIAMGFIAIGCIGYGLAIHDVRWIGGTLLVGLATLPVLVVLQRLPGCMPAIAWFVLRSSTAAWTMEHACAAAQHPQAVISHLGRRWLVQAARAASLDDLVLWMGSPPPVRADIAAAELARRTPDSRHRN